MDNKECGEAKDRKPPGVGYHCVIPIWQSFILGNIEKELHETSEQRRAHVVDVLSSADAVSVLRPEEDVTELLWMGNGSAGWLSATNFMLRASSARFAVAV